MVRSCLNHLITVLRGSVAVMMTMLATNPFLVTASEPKTTDEVASSSRPNILILYADDLGFGDLGCYHTESKIPTPNLDRLAAEGIRFNDGHSSSGICTPSRYALLTGQYHWRDFHGIVTTFGSSVFRDSQITMPEMLRDNGYRTAAIGKWHLGWDWEAIAKPGVERTASGRHRTYQYDDLDWSMRIPDGPLDHGFDHYFGDTVVNFPPYCWIEDDRVIVPPNTMMDPRVMRPAKEGRFEYRPGPMVRGWDSYDNIPTTVARGIKYIEDQAEHDAPFFLYFAFPSPHAPIVPNDEFDGKSGAGPYGDFVVETDDACGRLLQALEKSGQADNTLVIFTADNGPEKYAYLRDEKTGHWSSHPLRGLKRDIYEGGHHVPVIVRWPTKVRGGQVCDALVSQIDLMATVASIVDAELPDDCAVDSHDLLPLILGQATQVRSRHVHNTNKDHYAIREDQWLLVDGKNGYVSARDKNWERRHEYPKDDKLPVELYNLREDIGQRTNLASQHPERVESMQRTLRSIRQDGHSAPRLE